MLPPVRDACILAAGRGQRLGPQFDRLPKGFIRLGDQPIVVESIERLRRVGIARVLIVTGFLSEWYEALDGVTTVRNDAFFSTGTLGSLRCAEPMLSGDFLLVEADLVYSDRALDACQTAREPNLIVASGPTNAGDEIYVETSADGALVHMSKDPRAVARCDGEFVGISRISRSLLTEICALEVPDSGSYDTDGYNRCAKDVRIGTTVIPDLVWAEIDDPEQLRNARVVHERLQNEGASDS